MVRSYHYCVHIFLCVFHRRVVIKWFGLVVLGGCGQRGARIRIRELAWCALHIGVYESTRVCFLSLFLCLGAMAGIKIFAHVGRKEKNPPPLVYTIKFTTENHVKNPAFWGLENTKNRKSRLFVPPIIDTPPDYS